MTNHVGGTKSIYKVQLTYSNSGILIEFSLFHDGFDKSFEGILDHGDMKLSIAIRGQFNALGERHLHGGDTQRGLGMKTTSRVHQDVDTIISENGKCCHKAHHGGKNMFEELALGRGGKQGKRRLNDI